MQSPFLISTPHCIAALHHKIKQTQMFFLLQATNSQTLVPELLQAPESSPTPTPSLTTTTSKKLEEEGTPPITTELSETTSEFAPTEAFPRLNCGGRGFYQVVVQDFFMCTCLVTGCRLVLFLHLLQIPFL